MAAGVIHTSQGMISVGRGKVTLEMQPSFKCISILLRGFV